MHDLFPRGRKITQLLMLLMLAGCSQQTSITRTVSSGTQFGVTGDASALYFDLQGLIWRLSPDNRNAVALTGPTDDARRPQLSPDGEWLLFQSFATGAWDIVVMRSDGTARRNLTNSASDDREPAWSADGRKILFASDRSGNEDIWSVDVATGELGQLTNDPADDYAPASISDKLLFVSERTGKPVLYVQTAGAPAAELAVAPAGRLHPPRASRDGTFIAWVQATERNGFPAVAVNELVLYDTTAGTSRTLSATGSDVFGMAPAWLDNDTLVYTADGKIRSINVQTDQTAELPFMADLPLQQSSFQARTPLAFSQQRQAMLGIVDPVMLPDDRIAFTALGDLWIVAGDNTLTQLTNDHFVERDVTVSPNGNTLAYISDRDGSMQIWLHALDTDIRRRVTNNSTGPRYPSFSPDGKLIAYQQVGPIGTQDFT
ncbi:MAG: hypothetical protein ACR2P6_06535, partial [Gammaproteobacteria bacterium]